MLDKKLAAVCGLYCGACSLFIATTDDPERLKGLAEKSQLSEEAVKCYGCRSDIKPLRCKECRIFACAAQRGINFCSECEKYPCEYLKKFQCECSGKSQLAMPHRIELWDNLEHIKNIGYIQWLQKILESYSCPRCQTINSTYDLKCRKCGQEPSCDYVRRHKRAIEQYLANR